MNLERQENPWIYAELLLVFLIVLLLLFIFWRRRCERINPCQGYLGVYEDRQSRPLWFKDLNGRNTWKLQRDLPPAKTSIMSITIRSTRGSCGRDPYENQRIWVQFTLLSLHKQQEPPL